MRTLYFIFPLLKAKMWTEEVDSSLTCHPSLSLRSWQRMEEEQHFQVGL